MKAYKGFHRNEDGTLNCRDFTYEVGKTYKYDGGIELCERGFHACHELHQCWQFYPNNGNNVFCEVECGGEIIESAEGDGKSVCSEITILREVDMSGVEAFDGAGVFHEGYARVWRDGKCNHISTDGKLVSEEWWYYAWDFHEGYARVCKRNKFNHISIDGKLVSDEWWNFALDFHEGYALVNNKGGRRNHISTDGQMLSTEWWDAAGNFYGGFTWVRKEGKRYKIDTEGKVTE